MGNNRITLRHGATKPKIYKDSEGNITGGDLLPNELGLLTDGSGFLYVRHGDLVELIAQPIRMGPELPGGGVDSQIFLLYED